MKTILLLLITPFLIGACTFSPKESLPTVKNFQPAKYAGEWHEVARLPNFFERNLVAAKATYELQKDGKISVHNEGMKKGGERTSIRGAATPVRNTPKGEAWLKVRFNRFPASLFAGDYLILDLDDSHTRAIVGSPNMKFLWLLAKDPQSTPADFSVGMKKMEGLGFDTSQLITNPERIR